MVGLLGGLEAEAGLSPVRDGVVLDSLYWVGVVHSDLGGALSHDDFFFDKVTLLQNAIGFLTRDLNRSVSN